MPFKTLENYLFIPNSNEHLSGCLYELVKSNTFEKNSFVILPYQNPQKKIIEAQFYKIEKKIIINNYKIEKNNYLPIKIKAQTSKENYLKKIKELKNHIQLGNIYEINYCIQFYSENVIIDPLSIFYHLHKLAKAPYSALLKINNNFIISASPELFLKKQKSILTSKPIKGTIRRGKNVEEDEVLKNTLHTSIKERTENVMAVDVVRNDFSIIAKKGSVRVNKLYNIESFETVHQMVSEVSCEIKEGINFNKIIESTFPMASMTGAPKLKAMTLIDEFEDFHRDYYSGAMGLIDENEDFILFVTIRSIFFNQSTKKLTFSVGSAITHLSEVENEFEECLLKAKALLKVLDAKII